MLTQSAVEAASLEWLASLGYPVEHAPSVAPVRGHRDLVGDKHQLPSGKTDQSLGANGRIDFRSSSRNRSCRPMK